MESNGKIIASQDRVFLFEFRFSFQHYCLNSGEQKQSIWRFFMIIAIGTHTNTNRNTHINTHTKRYICRNWEDCTLIGNCRESVANIALNIYFCISFIFCHFDNKKKIHRICGEFRVTKYVNKYKRLWPV